MPEINQWSIKYDFCYAVNAKIFDKKIYFINLTGEIFEKGNIIGVGKGAVKN